MNNAIEHNYRHVSPDEEQKCSSCRHCSIIQVNKGVHHCLLPQRFCAQLKKITDVTGNNLCDLWEIRSTKNDI